MGGLVELARSAQICGLRHAEYKEYERILLNYLPSLITATLYLGKYIRFKLKYFEKSSFIEKLNKKLEHLGLCVSTNTVKGWLDSFYSK